jgi:uncharacterized Fe-S cluster-containing protein
MRNDKLAAAIARKAAELAALELKATEAAAAERARRAEGVTVKLHLSGTMMKSLCNGVVDDVEDKLVLTRAIASAIERAVNPPPRREATFDLHRGQLQGHQLLRTAGVLKTIRG